jgi:hypothetical protein
MDMGLCGILVILDKNLVIPRIEYATMKANINGDSSPITYFKVT